MLSIFALILKLAFELLCWLFVQHSGWKTGGVLRSVLALWLCISDMVLTGCAWPNSPTLGFPPPSPAFRGRLLSVLPAPSMISLCVLLVVSYHPVLSFCVWPFFLRGVRHVPYLLGASFSFSLCVASLGPFPDLFFFFIVYLDIWIMPPIREYQAHGGRFCLLCSWRGSTARAESSPRPDGSEWATCVQLVPVMNWSVTVSSQVPRSSFLSFCFLLFSPFRYDSKAVPSGICFDL